VFQILRDLVDRNNKTVVAVTHDLDLAQRALTVASGWTMAGSCRTTERYVTSVRSAARGWDRRLDAAGHRPSRPPPASATVCRHDPHRPAERDAVALLDRCESCAD
jgi:hypothetical protein